MTYRPLRAREPLEQTQNTSIEEQLLPEELAGYIRQSTTKQVRGNLESADLQLSGFQRHAIKQGLDADKIVIAWEGEGKRGVSGTLRIDQRDKLQEIMAGIYAGKIKKVWAYSVSRLFRDKYGVQVGTFIQACAQHHVKVAIETAQIFDFTDKMHVLIFQILANVAAKENDDRNRLLREASRNKALRGEYDGRALTPGFIVDRDKTSPTYNKYIPYPPHADVVNRLLARHYQLGEFNRLANEVEKMRVVFPPFDDRADQESIAQFRNIRVCAVHGPDRKTRVRDKDGKGHVIHIGCQFKGEDCKFIGYHLSSDALKHLLMAPELMGYWTVGGKNPDGTPWREVLTDANGEPLRVHARIVDDPTKWEYSFYKYSPTLLDGTPNPNWIDPRATWRAATVKQVGREPQTFLLDGILTSPRGTVHLSSTGAYPYYFVTERRGPNTNKRSNTLTINAHWIEYEFRRRLLDRIENTNYEQMLYDALRNVQAHNARALVSVDKQIANYEQTIKIKQAKIDTLMDALGEKADKPTLERYNQDILDARANIAALKAKQKEAAAEEQDLQELCTELWNFRNHGKRTNEKLIRFIRLATAAVVIDEYSSHFITLTIHWCTPFPQVDVCYFYREDGGRQPWSEQDIADLTALYPQADRLKIMQRFPTRSWISIMAQATSDEMRLKRLTTLNTFGIVDRSLSLADHELMQRYGWNAEKGAHWLIDVSSDSGDLPNRLGRAECAL